LEPSVNQKRHHYEQSVITRTFYSPFYQRYSFCTEIQQSRCESCGYCFLSDQLQGSKKNVRIIYSRPNLTSPKTGEKRSLADLAPVGKVWRTGANEAPEITFYQDVVFAGKAVKAGTYALFTIPGEGEWTVILNTNLNQWGAYFYDSAADVVRVQASASSDSISLEQFSIAYKNSGKGVELVMGWDTTRVSLPISW
jgi:hypothetical protein